VLKGLHVTRLPDQRQAILDGSFQRYKCEVCASEFVFEGQTIYTDFSRMEYIAIEAPPIGDWRADRDRHMQIYDTNVEFGPPVAKELASGLRTRLVYGLAALREKLMVWDEGIDDRVLELCKAAWFEREKIGPTDFVLRLDAVLPGQHLILAQLEKSPEDPTVGGGYTLPKRVGSVVVRNQDIARNQRRQQVLMESAPWLRESWLVDFHDAHPSK